MRVSADIERLRHAKEFRDRHENLSWEDFKSGIDGIAGTLTTSGLVHALLAGLRPRQGETAQHARHSVNALACWLQNGTCPVEPEVSATLPAGTQRPVSAEQLVEGLMRLNDVRRAMVIQAEASRYLAQAKLLASAFKAEAQPTTEPPGAS